MTILSPDKINFKTRITKTRITFPENKINNQKNLTVLNVYAEES